MTGYLDKEGRKLHSRKTRFFKLKDSALFNHRRKVRSLRGNEELRGGGGGERASEVMGGRERMQCDLDRAVTHSGCEWRFQPCLGTHKDRLAVGRQHSLFLRLARAGPVGCCVVEGRFL